MHPPTTQTSSAILLVTGERQVGKSTLLARAVTRLREVGLQVSGLLTRRTGPHDLTVTELHTGEVYALTDPFVDIPGSPTRNFTMNEAAFARSREALAGSFPTQVFVLDEIGPLELRRRRGWIDALELLRREQYALAIVVVRSELLPEAVDALEATWATLLRITPDNREAVLPALVRWIIAVCASQESVSEMRR